MHHSRIGYVCSYMMLRLLLVPPVFPSGAYMILYTHLTKIWLILLTDSNLFLSWPLDLTYFSWITLIVYLFYTYSHNVNFSGNTRCLTYLCMLSCCINYIWYKVALRGPKNLYSGLIGEEDIGIQWEGGPPFPPVAGPVSFCCVWKGHMLPTFHFGLVHPSLVCVSLPA